MENHIVNIIITNFLAIHVHGVDALFNPRLFERLKLTVRGVPINWPVIQVIAAFEKRWCAECFQCYTCNKAISPREKFIEYDMKPICKKCFGTVLRSIIFYSLIHITQITIWFCRSFEFLPWRNNDADEENTKNQNRLQEMWITLYSLKYFWPWKDHFPYELKKRLKKGADCYAKDRKTQIKNEKKAS